MEQRFYASSCGGFSPDLETWIETDSVVLLSVHDSILRLEIES